MFYAKRTVTEQKNRLPINYQQGYEASQLDRIEINGNVFQGYFEYSFLSEKSYREQPVRSNDGSIPDINQYATFLTPRLIIKYNMMEIEDYRNLMTLLQSKNEFTVSCYDIVQNKRVTHKMYAAPSSMPIIYQKYLNVLGIQECSIELIGTNNDVETSTLTYNYNFPNTRLPSTTFTQDFPHNVSDIIGGTNTTITIGESVYPVNSAEVEQALGGYYKFKCWSTKQDGTGFNYADGDAYFIHKDTTLYAIWER